MARRRCRADSLLTKRPFVIPQHVGPERDSRARPESGSARIGENLRGSAGAAIGLQKSTWFARFENGLRVVLQTIFAAQTIDANDFTVAEANGLHGLHTVRVCNGLHTVRSTLGRTSGCGSR